MKSFKNKKSSPIGKDSVNIVKNLNLTRIKYSPF
jgi:hypothetical protein